MMFTIERALAVMGDRDSITSAELVRALDPHWLRRGDTPNQAMQRAGRELSYAFGPTVKPERVKTEHGHRSVYHRADLEAALRATQSSGPVAAPVVPLRTVSQTTHAPAKPSVDGLVYCGNCGKGNPWTDHPCWSCGSELQP